MLFLFLTGCSATNEMNTGLALRSRLLQAQSCSFSVCINVENREQLYGFSADCRVDPKGTVTFTVTEPDTISGISGVISAEGGKLTFDDTALDFGLLADDQLSPVSAPWILMNALRSGCITSACSEENGIRLSVDDGYEEDSLRLDIWLDSNNLPEHADILHNGRRILSLDVSNFVIV